MARKQKASETAQPRPWRRRIALAVRTVILALPLALLAAAAYWAYSSPSGVFALSKVEFEGLEQLKRSDLETRIRPKLSHNILQIDLDEIRYSIEQASWVKIAVVRRRLPDQLIISIQERKPAAVAQVGKQMMLVDADGVLLGRLDPGDPLPQGPVVIGLLDPEEKEARQKNTQRMHRYLEVIQDLAAGQPDYARSVSEVDVSNLNRVAVVPSDEPVPIRLGDRDFRRRYQVFLSQKELYFEYKRKHGRIDEVDVSFERQIIFKTPSQSKNAVNLQPPANGTGL